MNDLPPLSRSPDPDPRLDERSDAACPVCWGPMTVGEDESGGVCGPCYWTLVAKDDE